MNNHTQSGSVRGFTGVAVFEPEAYDPAPHSPSPIFIREIEDDGPLPEGWPVTPVFSRKRGKSIAFLDTGDADLYGMGEAMTGLRRNDDWQILCAATGFPAT